MTITQIEKDPIIYNAAISACEKGQQWQLALGLLAEMAGARVETNVITYSAVVSACEKGLQWQLSLWLLKEMALVKVVWVSRPKRAVWKIKRCMQSFQVVALY